MQDDTATEMRLPWRVKFAFGTGALGELVYLGMFNTFIGIFYNQAIGLSNTLIGTAIMLALIGDAVSDPVVGLLSDRLRSRWGRRHPFLFLAPLPLAISLYFIFNPPDALTTGDVNSDANQLWLFTWLACWTVVSRLCVTLYVVPHLALGGELSKDQHQRSQLFSCNAIFGYATGAVFAFVAWSYFLSGDVVRADGATVPGHLDPTSYGPLVLLAGAAVLIGIWISAVGTLDQVGRLSTAPLEQESMSPGLFVRETLGTLRNRNYVYLLVGFFFFMISSGLYETFSIFVATYFWELKPDQIRWIGLAAAPAVALGAIASPLLMKRFDRLPVLAGSLLAVMVFAQLVIDLRLLELFPSNDSSAAAAAHC